MLKVVTGNLLDAKVEALVNTVNTAGVMGKGLALQFKKAFPVNCKAYELACKRGEVQIGKMFVFEAGGIVLPRYIINFPTKKHWRGASKLEYIKEGLTDLVHVIRDRNIRSIAIPPLGAGLGGLEWSEVRPLIEAALAGLADVDVRVFEPKGAPPPAEMKNETTRPNMTPGRAAVIALMSRYLVPGYDYLLSLLEVQKLAYFLQAAGQPLQLEYKAHIYGPYADKLRHVLHRLEGHFIEGFGDGENKPTTPLKLLAGAAEEAESFLAVHNDTQTRLTRVAEMIEGYETPFGMELLATVHWAASHGVGAVRSQEATVDAVHAWSERKAATMQPAQIRAAWAHLNDRGWLDEGATVHRG
jgi:O-acetyl-ADP-ribose deacetylase (regulator of RNase III)